MLLAGEGVDFVTRIEPAAQILGRIVIEAGEALTAVMSRRT